MQQNCLPTTVLVHVLLCRGTTRSGRTRHWCGGKQIGRTGAIRHLKTGGVEAGKGLCIAICFGVSFGVDTKAQNLYPFKWIYVQCYY